MGFEVQGEKYNERKCKQQGFEGSLPGGHCDWHDKAGNAVALTDNQAGGTLTFVNLAVGQPESLQANLIMPEPTDFIKGLPEVAIIRPTGAGQIDAVGAINGFIADGLFIGQPKAFNELLLDLAADADRAEREL